MASPADNNLPNNYWLCTQTRGDQIEFEWTIEKFHLLPHKNGEAIYSPVFSNNSTEQWQLQIYPQGESKEDAGWIAVFLSSVLNRMIGIEVKFEIAILRLKNTLETIEFTYKFDKYSEYGCPQLIERSKLSVQDDPTDAITIRCKIEALGTYTVSSSEHQCPNKRVTFGVGENGLCRDFKSLYKNPKLTDFTVISGDKTFPVHKVILASRSPVFAAMFQHKKVNENVKNEVKIASIEPVVVEALLEFIYTDEVSNIRELAHELLAPAEQYELDDLKELCEKTLCLSLNENNAVVLVALADLHNANYLKKCAIQYIVEHPGMVQQKFSEFVELPQQLSAEIIRSLALKASEKRAK